MKTGIVSSPFYPESRSNLGDLLRSFEELADSGMYEVIEFYYEGKSEDYELIGEKLAELKLDSVFLAGFEMKRDKIDLGISDDNIRTAAINRCKDFIDYAKAAGSGKMLILSGPAANSADNPSAYLDRFADAVRELCQYSALVNKERNFEIALEFFNNIGEPYLAIGDLKTVSGLMSRTDDLNGSFGLTFDTSHVVQLGERLNPSYQLLKKYVRHIHFANCVTKDQSDPLFGDKHPPFNIQGGDLTNGDIIEFMKIVDRDATDVCSFEIIPGEQYDREYSLNSVKQSYTEISS